MNQYNNDYESAALSYIASEGARQQEALAVVRANVRLPKPGKGPAIPAPILDAQDALPQTPRELLKLWKKADAEHGELPAYARTPDRMKRYREIQRAWLMAQQGEATIELDANAHAQIHSVQGHIARQKADAKTLEKLKKKHSIR